MSTEQVELLITRPIESLLNGIPEVMHVRSESIAGLSVITITFMDSSNRTENSQMVLEKLNGVSSILPEKFNASKNYATIIFCCNYYDYWFYI